MESVLNIYCDESCHLEHDASPLMVLGALVCPQKKTFAVAKHIRKIKEKHNLARNFEIKWNKVSKGQAAFYLDIVQFFFECEFLTFRGLVADKTQLDHERFNQSHNEWYFKMLYFLLNPLFSPTEKTHIYLDKKDTRSAKKAQRLHEIICSAHHDFDKQLIERIQNVESHQVVQIQLADFFAGALGYANRQLSDNSAKNEIIALIRAKTRYSLTKTTLLKEKKFNICVWRGRSRTQDGRGE